MAELFSVDWMAALKNQWNSEPDVKDKLAEIGFSAVIACGFKGDDQPAAIIVVENGECTHAGNYDGETPEWDMRASRKDWMKWFQKGIGLTGMGMAYTMGKLKFKTGDYTDMAKNPQMAKAIVKSFSLMKNIDTE